jgi:hypothetical protein
MRFERLVYRDTQKAQQFARANAATGGDSVACLASKSQWQFARRGSSLALGKAMKPPFPTREEFIAAWITMSKFPHGSPEHKDAFWAFQHMYDLIHEQPDVAFGLIGEIWARDQSRPVVQTLSAGPLEDLLATHGPEMISRVEEEAEKNPSFRKLLGGVRKRDMPAPVWSKVQAIWDRRGWDGIPEEGAQPGGTDNSGAAPGRV